MSFKFLFDEWFVKVDELKVVVGDIEVFVFMVDLVINLIVIGIDFGDVDIVLNVGMIEKGYKDGVLMKMILLVDLV